VADGEKSSSVRIWGRSWTTAKKTPAAVPQKAPAIKIHHTASLFFDTCFPLSKRVREKPDLD
jgi:hypothetical protein